MEKVHFGDEVYGRSDTPGAGTYAEFVAVGLGAPARKPDSLDHVNAAAVPLAALTAWQALYNDIGLKPGQSVLIHGAAGGVGTFAVQLAKWTGARVIATSSARNQGFLTELGADRVIDYTTRRFEEEVHEVDAVLDSIGGETRARSWGVLRRGGVMASIVGPPGEQEAREYGVRAVGVQGRKSGARELAQITRPLDRKTIRPIVSEVLPLAEAQRAQQLSESGHVRGKIVLRAAKA